MCYEAGRDASNTEAQSLDAKNKNAANGKTGRRKGTVKGEGVTIDDLKKTFNDTQGKAYKYLSTVAEVTGIDIVLYRSEAGPDGEFQGAQGRYRRSEPGTIYIDLNAGLSNIESADDLAKYAMLRTFAHEFTHFIENWNPIQYNELRKVVFDTLTERGENVNDLIEDKQARNPGMSYDKASREVVAEAMTDILPDANFVQELAEKHKNIFQKLLDKLKELADNLREYFKSIGRNPSKEANALKEWVGDTVKYVDSIVQMFDKAAVQAVENYQQTVATENVALDSVAKNDAQNQNRDYLEGWNSYELDPEFANEVNYEDKHSFLRSLANQTTGIEEGETRRITISGMGTIYFFNATGYMNGNIENKIRITDKNQSRLRDWRKEYINGTVTSGETFGKMAQGYELQRGGDGWYRASVGNLRAAGQNDDVDVKTSGSDAFRSDWESLGYSSWEELREAVDSGAMVVDENGDLISFEQYQQRTDTLTDRDVLDIVEKRGMTEMLSAGQVSTLQTFNKKNAEIGELLKQKAKQEKTLKDLQKAAKPDEQEIVKTQNRIKTIEGQIKRESSKLREYETMDSVKGILEKVKPAVEKKLIEERKEELAKYGTIPQGEKAVRASDLPTTTDGKNKVSRTARTVYEAGVTPDDFADLIDKEVYLNNGLTYLPITNNATVQKATEYIEKVGWKKAMQQWQADVLAGKASAEISAIGALLLNNAAKAGDKNAWLDILYSYRMMGTNAAQATQALRILKNLQPDDKLHLIEKSIEQMVQDMHLGFDIKIDFDIKEAYLNAETYEEEDWYLSEIMQGIADQIPSTLMDKWTALRYVNMLGNLRTQVRNVIGNFGMKVVTTFKDTNGCATMKVTGSKEVVRVDFFTDIQPMGKSAV